MRSSQFRGISWTFSETPRAPVHSPRQAPMLFETYTTWQLNEKIFNASLQFYFFKKS